ncbi:MAG: hypothetical protein ABSC08_16050, partial [Bryobacteraceae bacterium]
MPFISRAALNRRNAQLSTGPVSDAGKLAVRSNALKHGFYSHCAVLEDAESQADFDALQRDYFDHLAPAGPIELELAARLVLSLWQLRRLQTAESQACHLNLVWAGGYVRKFHSDCRQDTFGFAFKHDFQNDTSFLEGFARHRVRWERTYYRALHELERLQLVRRGHAVPPPQILEIHANDDAPLPTAALPAACSPAAPPAAPPPRPPSAAPPPPSAAP